MKSFKEWLLAKESSPFTRLRKTYPELIPAAGIHSRSTATQAQVDRVLKKKKKKRKKK